MPETLKDTFEFTEDVVTLNGVTKTVVAGNAQELAEAVAAAKDETVQVRPDINNPDHANVTDAEFVPANQPDKESVAQPVKVTVKEEAMEEEEKTPQSEVQPPVDAPEAPQEETPEQEAPEPGEVAKEEAMPVEEPKADENVPAE